MAAETKAVRQSEPKICENPSQYREQVTCEAGGCKWRYSEYDMAVEWSSKACNYPLPNCYVAPDEAACGEKKYCKWTLSEGKYYCEFKYYPHCLVLTAEGESVCNSFSNVCKWSSRLCTNVARLCYPLDETNCKSESLCEWVQSGSCEQS